MHRSRLGILDSQASSGMAERSSTKVSVEFDVEVDGLWVHKRVLISLRTAVAQSRLEDRKIMSHVPAKRFRQLLECEASLFAFS